MKSLDKELILSEINESGVEVDRINDLMTIDKRFKDLIPIILKHLVDIEDEKDKEFLVRCLGVKGFVSASRILIDEFYKTNNLSFKWAIGNTLSIIRDDTIIPELIQIVKNKEHGIARQMIVDSLGAFKGDNIKTVLIELLDDEEVVGHAISAISKMGDSSLTKFIEPFVNHKVSWIRNEAKKTIKKLKKLRTYEE